MSKPKFTPGPWRYDCSNFHTTDGRAGVHAAVFAGDHLLNRVITTVEEGFTEVKANATLIAAAPEMYEFINWLRSVEGQCAIIKGKKYLPVILDKVDEILKKARGEE